MTITLVKHSLADQRLRAASDCIWFGFGDLSIKSVCTPNIFFHGIDARSWETVAGFVADGYQDQWSDDLVLNQSV